MKSDKLTSLLIVLLVAFDAAIGATLIVTKHELNNIRRQLDFERKAALDALTPYPHVIFGTNATVAMVNAVLGVIEDTNVVVAFLPGNYVWHGAIEIDGEKFTHFQCFGPGVANMLIDASYEALPEGR